METRPHSKTYFAALLAIFATAPAQAAKPAPTYQDVAYGPHERNVLDFWKAKSARPTPLAIFIHGGGFAVGGKESIPVGRLNALLDAGISVAAVNYRYYSQAPLPAALHDCRRALQFLRSKAKEWNIDPSRIGATGGSAGAVASMYLAFHDDMANPDSEDPVERESTRLTCVATTAGQTTLDIAWWAAQVPGWPTTEGVKGDTHAFHRWGCSEADYPDLIQEGSALNLISADDPPIWMSYAMGPDEPPPMDAKAALNWRIHHVAFGVALKQLADQHGIESHLRYPGAPPSPYDRLEEFLRAKLVEGK